MPDWVKVYQRLPYPLRVVAASGRGYYLRRWRFGADFDERVEEVLARERWDDARFKSWIEERTARVLDHAARRVPYYRELWSERRRKGDRRPWDVLLNWPVLRKDDLRSAPRAFVAEGRDSRSLLELHTSGTTGKPLTLWRGRHTNREWYALCEARISRWNGVSRRNRWAVLGGQLIASVEQHAPPYWVWNRALNQLYMSSYHLAPQNIPAYVKALRSYGIECMEGYPSSMHSVAAEALRSGLETAPLRVAISNAEPLSPVQRASIEEAFRCPVRNTYGTTEAVVGASECEHGTLHLWPEAGVLEVLAADEDRAVARGTPGRLVCTGLLNLDMPLVRYELGDSGAEAPAVACACGRTLPALQDVVGRLDDVIVTADGRRIGRLDPVFKGDLPVVEAQVVQENRGRIVVRLVPAPGYGPEHARLLRERMLERVGEMEVVIQEVASISRSSNGKFRAVVSHVGAGS